MADRLCTDSETTLLTVTTKNGCRYQIECSDKITDLILSPTTDPSIKELVVNSLIKDSKEKQESEKDPCTSTTKKKKTTTKQSSTGNTLFHVWSEKEEDILVFHRHERNDDFLKNKNHTKLWEDICKELKFAVTPQQAFYKYASLKKKWKELIDAPSGTETRYFRHKTSFDNMYGTKASTRPKSSIDTDKTHDETDKTQDEPDKTQEEESITIQGQNDSTREKKIEKKETKNKRKLDVIDSMKEQYGDFIQRMEKMHHDKMRRQDRLNEWVITKMMGKNDVTVHKYLHL